jgi:hypothetical protein
MARAAMKKARDSSAFNGTGSSGAIAGRAMTARLAARQRKSEREQSHPTSTSRIVGPTPFGFKRNPREADDGWCQPIGA